MTSFFQRQPDVTPSYTLRALAHLLSYPGAELRAVVPELQQVLANEGAVSDQRLLGLNKLLGTLVNQDPFAVEEAYVELFDRGRSTSLHLFEHVHGDSRDRGPAMIDLVQTYEKAGLFLGPEELPDHLGVVLEFASTQPPALAKAFLGEMAHILNAVFSALLKRESPYAAVIAAVLELAGQKVQAVAIPVEESLDESWVEPQAFDGCSTQGQARPGQAQPIHIVRKNTSTSKSASQGATA